MAKTANSPFKLTQVIVEDFSIKRNPDKQGKFDIKIIPSGFLNPNRKDYMLTLEVNIKDENETFVINMSVLGYFTYKDVEGEEHLNDYFYTNAPALVFPFIRSYVTAVTALSGLNPINLPIMNLSGLKAELKKNTRNVPAVTE